MLNYLLKNRLNDNLYSEFNGDFKDDNFEYSYVVSREDECVYLNLKCKKDHEVKINDKTYKVSEGKILGTVVNKYSQSTVEEIGLKVGLKTVDTWTSDDGLIMNVGLGKES